MDTALSSAAQADTEYPTDTSLESISIVGTPVACATYDSALERIKAFARESQATAVCPCNTHILAEARHNPEFARVLARFDLVLPDGMPVVWALNFRGAGLKDPVAGPYFMRHVLRSTPRPWRHFFFGDSEECLVELRRVLVQLQPDIEIAGMLSPPFRPFTEADEASFADAINRADPDFVWVALPGVRMERWIIDNRARYRGGVFLRSAMRSCCQQAPTVRSDVDARMGLTWAPPIKNLSDWAALPAVQFHVRILLAMGRPARLGGRRLKRRVTAFRGPQARRRS
jgi:N-acetylglucosaminyldiphosphoundecaprenol N-acetyl-beta-D-mannosaminyltransferase